jgi:hypothetical protein
LLDLFVDGLAQQARKATDRTVRASGTAAAGDGSARWQRPTIMPDLACP